jgi:hypothetical protein
MMPLKSSRGHHSVMSLILHEKMGDFFRVFSFFPDFALTVPASRDIR